MSTEEEDIETRHWSTHAIKGPSGITARLCEDNLSLVEIRATENESGERIVLCLTAREWRALCELRWRLSPEEAAPKVEPEPTAILTGQGRALLAESLTTAAKKDGIEVTHTVHSAAAPVGAVKFDHGIDDAP